MKMIGGVGASQATGLGAQPATDGLVQQPYRAQHRSGHTLEQRGMHGQRPSGMRQGEAVGPSPAAMGATSQFKDATAEAAATASAMNGLHNSQKLLADTCNAIISGMADSASKASNAASEAAKGIKV